MTDRAMRRVLWIIVRTILRLVNVLFWFVIVGTVLSNSDVLERARTAPISIVFSVFGVLILPLLLGLSFDYILRGYASFGDKLASAFDKLFALFFYVLIIGGLLLAGLLFGNAYSKGLRLSPLGMQMIYENIDAALFGLVGLGIRAFIKRRIARRKAKEQSVAP